VISMFIVSYMLGFTWKLGEASKLSVKVIVKFMHESSLGTFGTVPYY